MSQPTTTERQRRSFAIADLEVRVSAEGEAPSIAGYAAVFNQPSEIISDYAGTYREYIAPGAFKQTIAAGADVRALMNHDPNFVLGRTKSDTLTLREDSRGLWYEVTPPDTQWARDLMTTMRRGDIDQSSFAFRVIKDQWTKGKTADGKPLDEHTIFEAQLFDVSPVTYPAYPSTSSAVRALFDNDDALVDFIRAIRMAPEVLADFIRAIRMAPEVLADFRTQIERLTALLPASDPAPASQSDAVADSDPAPTGQLVTRAEPPFIDADRAARLRARLDRLARS